MLELPDSELPWWDRESVVTAAEIGDDLANAVCATVLDIEVRQVSIFEGNRRHARIYAGYLPNGLAWGSGPSVTQKQPFSATRAVIRSVCDTATALIVRSRPKPSFVTDGGDWKIQHQAEDLDQFMVGAYDLSGLYQVAPRCFHDSTVFGTGIWKYVPRGSGDNFHIATERVQPDDFVVDEDECRDCLDPQNTYHRMLVRTDALVKKYASGDTPEQRTLRRAIRASANGSHWPTRHVPKDRTILVEAIHVDPEGDDHRRILCVPGAVLRDEPWPYPWHPYTTLWWAQPITGYYGDGIAYRQYGKQERITYLYRWVQRCHDLFATPRAWVDPAGGPPTLQMSNEIGAIIMSRRPPTIQSQPVVPGEVFSWIDRLESGTFEDEGISQISSANQLPPGIESAPAQREYSFKEGQRFAPVSQRWEHAVAVEAATKMTEMYRRHASQSTDKVTVRWADRRLLHVVEWPDLQADAYRIRPEASSLDALSPAARTQSALELAQTGWITPSEGRALVGHPDLREADDLGNSAETYAKWVLRKLYRDEAVAVDELADVSVLDRVVRQGRLLAIQRSAPQKTIDGLARYLDEIDAMKAAAQAEAAAQMQAQQAVQPPGGQKTGAPAPGATVALPNAPAAMAGA